MNDAPQLIVNTLQPAAFKSKIGAKATRLFELVNNAGMRVIITNYGARLVSIKVPDKENMLTDVVVGYDKPDGYPILPVVNSSNFLRGGNRSFHDVIWNAGRVDSHEIAFSYLSGNMEQGFPAGVQVTVSYLLTDDNCLKITYGATADKSTIVNLTNPAFFNLNGSGSGTILNHQVQIKADHYIPVDIDLIPTGRRNAVAGTPFDFRNAATIGSRINDHNKQLKNGKGYDHNFVLNKHAARTPVARVKGDISGIVMEVFTDQPYIQFYSGNFVGGKNTLRYGSKEEYRTAFAMETQHFPDSGDQPAFPGAELSPGRLYKTITSYKFSC